MGEGMEGTWWVWAWGAPGGWGHGGHQVGEGMVGTR